MRVHVKAATWAEAWEKAQCSVGRRVLFVKVDAETIEGTVDPVDLEKLRMTPGIEVFPEVDHTHPWGD